MMPESVCCSYSVTVIIHAMLNANTISKNALHIKCIPYDKYGKTEPSVKYSQWFTKNKYQIYRPTKKGGK